VLSSSLDIDETLGNIARLAVRDLGDLCIIDLNEEGGGSGLLKVMSRDASKEYRKVSEEDGFQVPGNPADRSCC